MKNKLITFCLLTGLTLPVLGQITLDDCIQHAWQHNPGFKNTHIEIKEARTDYMAAAGQFLPNLSIQAQVGRHTGRSVDPATNGYTTDSYNQGTVGMEVTLSLFEGFARINRLRYARFAKKEKEWNRLAKQNELAYQVTEAYYKALLDENLEELAEEQLRLGEQYLKQTEMFVELGLKSASDWREMEARHQGDVFHYRSYEKNRKMSLLYLKETIGMKENDTLCIDLAAAEDTLILFPQTDVEGIYVQSLHVLPDYRRMEMWERAAHKEYSAALGEFSPTIYARFSFGSDFYESLYSLRQLRDRWNKYIGIGISFPVFSRLERYAGVKKKKLHWQRVRNQIEEEKLHLRTEAEQIALSLRSGWEEYRQVTLQVSAETQVLKETERKWEEGIASVFQLMEARNRLLAAKAEKIRVRLQYELTARLAMYYQTGTFIK